MEAIYPTITAVGKHHENDESEKEYEGENQLS
jgi:hypothetical protein